MRECLKHRGHKGDPELTPGTCGAIGERYDFNIRSIQCFGLPHVRSSPQSRSEVIYTIGLSKTVQLLVYFLLSVEVETLLRLL